MLRSIRPGGMNQTQMQLVECALRLLTRVSPSEWDEIPPELQLCFEKYMARDVWTGECDLLTLREAALMVVRDAITRTGGFAEPEA
jgi:hypothetical protein